MAVFCFSLPLLILTNNVESSFGAPAQHETSLGSNWSNWVSDGSVQINRDYSSWKDPDRSGYSTWTTTTTDNGECVKQINVIGNGVNDTFSFGCTGEESVYTSASDILITGSDTVQINSVYGKQPGKMQVIQGGKCSVRTYTISNGKTIASTSTVSEAECEAMKKEHLDRLEKWHKWSAESFPPCFPFCDTEEPGAAGFVSESDPSSGLNQNGSSWNASSVPGADASSWNDDFFDASIDSDSWNDDLFDSSSDQSFWDSDFFDASSDSDSWNDDFSGASSGQSFWDSNFFDANSYTNPWNVGAPFTSSNPILYSPQENFWQSQNSNPWFISPFASTGF